MERSDTSARLQGLSGHNNDAPIGPRDGAASTQETSAAMRNGGEKKRKTELDSKCLVLLLFNSLSALGHQVLQFESPEKYGSDPRILWARADM